MNRNIPYIYYDTAMKTFKMYISSNEYNISTRLIFILKPRDTKYSFIHALFILFIPLRRREGDYFIVSLIVLTLYDSTEALFSIFSAFFFSLWIFLHTQSRSSYFFSTFLSRMCSDIFHLTRAYLFGISLSCSPKFHLKRLRFASYMLFEYTRQSMYWKFEFSIEWFVLRCLLLSTTTFTPLCRACFTFVLRIFQHECHEPHFHPFRFRNKQGVPLFVCEYFFKFSFYSVLFSYSDQKENWN